MSQTTITAGMSVKRPGPQEYSSDGYTLALAVDLDAKNAEHVRAATKALFAEVRAALAAEMSNGTPTAAKSSQVDLWGASDGNGGDGSTGRASCDGGSRTDSGARAGIPGRRSAAPSPQPISNKQTRYLLTLARKAGLETQADVAGWIRDNLGVDRGVYDLSKVEASRAIDILNSNGNRGDGK
jgi:hypothetical protein